MSTTATLPRPAPPTLGPRPTRARDYATLAITATTAVGASIIYWAIHYSLGDDGYITLAYAKTLAFHGTWGMVPGHSANSATSPLNVMLIAAGTFVTRRPLLGLGFVFVGSATVLAWTTARTARALRLPVITALFAAALVLLNPFVLSSTGLESMLIAGLLAALLCCAVEGRVVLFGVVAGFAFLTRLDMVLFVVPLVLWSAPLRKQILRVAGISLAVCLPWFVFRWFVAGSAIPDTFVIKTLQHRFGDVTFANGPFKYIDGTGEVARWSFAVVLFAAIATVIWLGVSVVHAKGSNPKMFCVAALGLGGFAYYTAYAFLNVPAYHWYYCPVMAASAIVLSLLTGAAVRRMGRISRYERWAPLLFLPLVLLAGRQALVVKHHGLPWRHTPIFFGNWAEPAYYKNVGKELRVALNGKTVQSPGEIGALAFYCECNIVDEFSDQRLAIPLIAQRINQAGPLMRPLLNANYERLDEFQAPPHIDYYLIYIPGWDMQNARSDEYPVYSPARGFGRFRLVPASG